MRLLNGENIDEVLKTNNPEFRAWVDSLPAKHWAKYDLSACRLGWEAATERAANIAEASNKWPEQGEEIATAIREGMPK